jgi:hypothetical protein
MDQDSQIHKAAEAVFEIICGGLIGVNIIAIIQLIGLPALDNSLTFALYCFAVSLPLLAFFVFSILIEKTRNCSVDIWYKGVFLAIGVVSTIFGIVALIAHLSQTAALVFSILCMVATLFTQIHVALADRRGTRPRKPRR